MKPLRFRDVVPELRFGLLECPIIGISIFRKSVVWDFGEALKKDFSNVESEKCRAILGAEKSAKIDGQSK